MLTIFINSDIERVESRIFIAKNGKPYTFYIVKQGGFTLLAPPQEKTFLSFSARLIEPKKMWLLQTFDTAVAEPFFTFGVATITLPLYNSFHTPEGIKIVLKQPFNLDNFKTCFVAGKFNLEKMVVEAEMVKGIELDRIG